MQEPRGAKRVTRTDVAALSWHRLQHAYRFLVQEGIYGAICIEKTIIDCQRQDCVRVAPLVALDKRKAITLMRDRRLGWTIRGDDVFFDGLVGGKRQDKDAEHFGLISNSRSKVCVKYAGPMELWNDALVTPCEGQSRRRWSHLRLSANTDMLRTACFLCVIGHWELL